jgi:crotonobetainyl-CoA:carnitine CoA-transferase CaiB-like acyl-CoA transferase
VSHRGEATGGSEALAGVRVLDISAGMPAAIATMLLADYGAEVLHVELPSRLNVEYRSLRTWRRGRRRLPYDLLDPDDRDRVLDLARDADVVLVDLPPDEAGALGLGEDALRALNPDAVVLMCTGFGLEDDRDTPPIDVLVGAELGAMVAATPATRTGPVFLGHPAIAYSTAFLAVIGVLAALRGRLRTGRGDVVDVSLLDGLLAQFTMNWWTERNVSFLSDRRSDGQLDLGRTRMLVRRYTCADGRMIQVHTGAPGAFGRLMRLLGLQDEVSPALGPVEPATPLTDADVAVLERVPSIFATRPAGEWLEAIWDDEIAALPVLDPGEAFHDDQVRHNGLITAVTDDDLGPIEVVAPPIHLSLTPGRAAPVDVVVPRAALATDGVWHSAGLAAHSTPGAAGGSEPGAGPLAGVRIVEFSTFFASPYANRLLRDLGADVVKIEAMAGDPMRSLPDPFEGATHGKRAVAMDLKAPGARPLLDALLRSADVVQHNFRPGAAERLGIDRAAVRAINPAVVYDYAPGYGSSGPKSGLQSFAPLHSGFVGIQTEAAGAGNLPTITFGNEDYYNGQLNAIGTLLALVDRERTGLGQDVECAQLSSSVFVTSHWYLVDGVARTDGPALDAAQTGWSPSQRIYQCLEGWLCVCCTNAGEEAALREVVLGASTDGGGDRDGVGVAEQLEYELYGRAATEWVVDLRARRVPCTVVAEHMWVRDFMSDPAMHAAGRATRFEHHAHGSVGVIGQIVRLRSTPPREPARAPRLGEHTAEVFAELGIDQELVDRLVAEGAVLAELPQVSR